MGEESDPDYLPSESDIDSMDDELDVLKDDTEDFQDTNLEEVADLMKDN
jgi:hypothetical protein